MTGPDFASWREAQGLAQQAAAVALGLNLRTVQRYEAGTQDIPTPVALACRWLDTQRRLNLILEGATP